MLQRKIYKQITDFLKVEHKALLITGARQVGKTYIIRSVGQKEFENFVELNFIEHPEYRDIFSQPRDAKQILLILSSLTQTTLVPGKTLIFFDEIQECPEMVTAIKFLVDEGSYKYVLSGSRLGVELKDVRSVPVGYLSEKEMFPLDFEEFAIAVGMSDAVLNHIKNCYELSMPVDDAIHKKFMELLPLYLVVGGMPDAVMQYITTNNLQNVHNTQLDIINLYKKDISKYDADNKMYIGNAYDIIPSELNAKNKRFVLKSLNEKTRFDRIKNAFLWLADSGVALPTYNVEAPILPLKLGEQRNLFKLFMNDVGLLASQYAQGFVTDIITGRININFGAIYENFVAEELRAHGYTLYYFNSKKQGELDFLVEHDGSVLPIEVKSGKDYKRHNALSNVMNTADYNIHKAIVLSNSNIEKSGGITYLPIYMSMFIKPSALSSPVYHFTPM